MDTLAYLDPGSGSMVLQMLLGGIASAAVAVKMFGKQIWSTIAFWKKGEDRPAQSTTQSTRPAAPVESEKDPA